MLKKLFVAWLLICCIFTNLPAQSDWTEWSEDISTDEEQVSWQERYEELSELAEHPFNLNALTREELEQLPFLSDKQVENILYYVYKYGPVLSKNELVGVEGMDRQTLRFLKDFVYVGKAEKDHPRFSWKDIRKYNKQLLLTRLDVPLNTKAGYAPNAEMFFKNSSNKKYEGNSLYHNVLYRFQYRNRLFFGMTAEKDAGEPFFTKYNRKGYDSYTAYFFLRDCGKIKALALGHYKAYFGYGLVMNTGSWGWGQATSVPGIYRTGNGLMKYASCSEGNYLQGIGGTFRTRRWEMSVFYSYRELDARVDNGFIRTLKTDGYHRVAKDLEKKNTASNQLIGSNLSYKEKRWEVGLTTVYNRFNKVLNPDAYPYNRYYPRGNYFFNAGGYYKFFLHKFVCSGEVAFDKCERVAALNIFTYSPSVHTSWALIHRYYDKAYQGLYGNSFGENSRLQNEAGIYISLEHTFFDKLKLFTSIDVFHFPYRRYRVDKDHTSGAGGICQLSYSHSRSLNMLIKYSYKNKARNFTDASGGKYVLPYIRNRLHGQATYEFSSVFRLKTVAEYVHTSCYGQEKSDGFLVGGNGRWTVPVFPVKLSLSGCWFHTGNYDARVYWYEPGLLYTFSSLSFYGKGGRVSVKLEHAFKDRVTLLAKWGLTRYADRARIGSGLEEIQGNRKADLQFQLRVKW